VLKDFIIKPLNKNDLPLLIDFTDHWIGQNYYTQKDLEDIFLQSNLNGLNSSLVAWHTDRIIGVRFSLAPGQWLESHTSNYSERWGIDKNKVGYFKSLFICDEFRRSGLGSTLSNNSIEILKKMGAQAIICHSWLESPESSSQNYLIKNGFKEVGKHQKFWHHIDYQCTRCGPDRCICTAVEMILELK
jgi:ribosomal protein S18 acetylase RimI-like enzyme